MSPPASVDAGVQWRRQRDNRRRRLRAKTTVGHAAVFLATVAMAMPPVPPPASTTWADDFLQAEELGQESERRKAVYLVTLPHPKSALTDGA